MTGRTPARSTASRMTLACLASVASLVLVLSTACGEKKPEAPQGQSAAAKGAASMFGPTKAGGLPPPPVDGDAPQKAPVGGAGASVEPPLSPECKALEDEQKAARTEADRVNNEVIAPAAARAEAAFDEYQACQDDAGCISDLERYQAKQSALAGAKRAQQQAEKQVEEIETRLHDISQKMAAKCNTDPL